MYIYIYIYGTLITQVSFPDRLETWADPVLFFRIHLPAGAFFVVGCGGLWRVGLD